MRPSLSLCEQALASRAERNSKPFKVWRHRWVLKKVPGTLRAGPNAVVIQVINTWLGTWCVPNDSAAQQPSPGEAVHLPTSAIIIPLKHTDHQLGGQHSSSSPLSFIGNTSSCGIKQTLLSPRITILSCVTVSYPQHPSLHIAYIQIYLLHSLGTMASSAWQRADTHSTFVEHWH